MNNKYVLLLVTVFISTDCFADIVDILTPNNTVSNACNFQNTGVYQGGFVMIPIYEDTIYKCERGYYLPELSESCAQCPENSYCPGGDYTYSEESVGLYSCPEETFSSNGMWEISQCGRILHVGNDVLYLNSVQRTTPSLRLDLNHDGVADYFAHMTTLDVPMHIGTERKLKIRYMGLLYSVYDDTVEIKQE